MEGTLEVISFNTIEGTLEVIPFNFVKEEPDAL